MNFIKSFFTKQKGTQHELVDQEVFDFVILGTFYKLTEACFEKLSSNTEFVFDKLTNDEYDHILIVRLKRVSKHYNNTISHREGDYYFNFSFFKSIYHSNLNEEVEEIGIELVDSEAQNWSLRLQFSKNTNSDNQKFQKFKLFMNELLWIQRNKQALPQNQTAILGLIINKPSQKLVMSDLVQQKKMKKKLQRADRAILYKKPTQRRQEEREIIGDALNYFIKQNVDTVKQLYVGKLFILYPELVEIHLIDPIVIIALNIISKTDCRLELYNQDRQLLLIQPIKDFISFEVDQQNNFLSWVYFDGLNSIVLYFQFDIPDGATSMSLILQRARICLQNHKELNVDQEESMTRCSTATTISIDTEKLKSTQYYRFYDELQTISEGRDLIGVNNILSVKDDSIYLGGSQIQKHSQHLNIQTLDNYDKNVLDQIKVKNISIVNHVFDSCTMSTDHKALLLFKKNSKNVQIFDVLNKQNKIYELNENVIGACEHKNKFYVISQKSIYLLSLENNKQIHTQDKNTNHNYSAIKCTRKGFIIVGTKEGYTLIFEKGDNLRLINFFDGLGDPIIDIHVNDKEEFILMNSGYYFQIQQVITKICNGYLEKMDLKPFPIKVQLNPEDLIMLGIFEQPVFDLLRIDSTGNLIVANIDQLQIIWSVEQIILGHTNSYQMFILPEQAQDQQFQKQKIAILFENRLVLRNYNL